MAAAFLCYDSCMTTEEKFELLKDEIEVASKLARAYFDSEDFSNEQKEDGSVVTKIDQEIEKVLRDFIGRHFPDDAIVGEEQENKEGTSGFVWHIDPIDGTDNFLRKIPFCCISVARLGDTPEDSFAIIHNPITSHTFSSYGDNGHYENERIVKMTAEPLSGKYAFSVCRGRKKWMYPAGRNIIAALAAEYGKASGYGSCALEFAYVAAGRIDGLITFGLNTYDYGAGLYLVRAAGGAISVFEDGSWKLYEGSIKDLCDEHGKTIFVSHPDVHMEMRDFIGNPERWADE